MISKETRKKLITELEKDGNILNACRKVGVSPATFYRWRKNDAKFLRSARVAIDIGRQNMASIAEHALMLKIKDKDLGAIKWFQIHNDRRYKPKPRRVYIEHSRFGEEKMEFEKKKRHHYDELTEEWRKIGEWVSRMKDDRG